MDFIPWFDYDDVEETADIEDDSTVSEIRFLDKELDLSNVPESKGIIITL